MIYNHHLFKLFYVFDLNNENKKEQNVIKL